ncbi:MAG: 4Fe-4S dicluster domain-containing protein [Lawsonibacter sp.]|nr:4Fe-4S dicluster domain-containing protein [Lawsonibacter sp.]
MQWAGRSIYCGDGAEFQWACMSGFAAKSGQKGGNCMSQWAFFFRQDRCTGCGACVLACKAWNHTRRGDFDLNPMNRIGRVPPYLAEPDDALGTMQENWRRLFTRETGTCPSDMMRIHVTISCMHCSNPSCVAACPTHRLEKEPEFGAVLFHPDVRCISCGLCRKACPWQAPQFWKPYGRRDGEQFPPPMTKCDFCYERIRNGEKPACVAACPMRALIAGPEAELMRQYPEAVREMPGLIWSEQNVPHLWVVPREQKK